MPQGLKLNFYYFRWYSFAKANFLGLSVRKNEGFIVLIDKIYIPITSLSNGNRNVF